MTACKALSTYTLQCTPQPVCHACLNYPRLTEDEDNNPLPHERPWHQLLAETLWSSSPSMASAEEEGREKNKKQATNTAAL